MTVKITRLILIAFAVCLSGKLAHAAASKSLEQRQFEAYEDSAQLVSAELTLSATVGVVSTVTIPSWAKGVRMYSRTNTSRFAVQNGTTQITLGAVTALTSSADAVTTEALMAVGGILKNDQWETRLLPYDGRQRYLYLRSATASTVVDVEFF